MAWVRTIFAQPDHNSALEQLERVAVMLDPRYPKAAVLLREAAEEILAYLDLPKEHRARIRIHSTNPLERLNREIARRCDLVGIFPNLASALRPWIRD